MKKEREETKEPQVPREEDPKDQILRMRADFENAKKRLERDKLEAIKYANERLLAEVLPAVDNFDRAMASLAEGHDPGDVQKGLEIAQGELHAILVKHGVQVVKTVGSSFDPHVHEAVSAVESPTAKDGEILDEIQKGYLLNGRLIRPARVIVARHQDAGGQARQTEKDKKDSKEEAEDNGS